MTAVATAVTIIDPIGCVPITLSVTSRMTAQQRRRVVDRAILVATGVIFFMALVGRYVLEYLGITLVAFSIAGGILLLLISIDMLFARPSTTRRTDDEEREAIEQENPAVFPLAIPIIAGPGTLASVLLLVNLSRGDVAKTLVVFGAFASALLVTWLTMRSADHIFHVIGATGTHVLTRVLGIILSALAVQFVLNGLAESPLFHK